MNFYSNTLSRRLANGMEIYVLPRPCSTVMIECYIKTGSIHEGQNLGCGLSHFLEHMLFQGCKDYPGTAAADTLQEAGCDVNAYTSYDKTVYHTRGPANQLKLMLHVLSSMVRYPELPEKRFTAERDVILRECDRGTDSPERRMHEELFALMFRQHPLKYPVIGKREMIAQVSREMALDYHTMRYTPGRCFWVITGNVDPQQAFDLLEGYLGDWKNRNYHEAVLPREIPQVFPRSSEFVFTDSVSRLSLGINMDENVRQDMTSLDILFGLLGMGEGSRLNRTLELEKELALSLRSFFYLTPIGAAGGISAVSTPKNLDKLESALKRELEAIANGALSNAEIKREKQQQYAEHLRQLDDIEYVCSIIGFGVLENGNPALGDQLQKQLEHITPDTIRDTAAKYLDSNRFCIVKQHPAEKRKSNFMQSRNTVCINRLAGNGKTPLIHVPNRSIPLVAFSMSLPGGIFFETPGKSGSAKLAATMLGTGTTRFKETALLEKLDQYGARLSIDCGCNSCGIELDAPRKHFAKAMELLGEILSQPVLDDKVFLREKNTLCEYLASLENNPLNTAFKTARRTLLGNHPYASGEDGIIEHIRNLQKEDITDFWNRMFCGTHTACGFAGDCSEEEADIWGRELFDKLPASSKLPVFPDLPVFPESNRKKRIELDREQTAVVAAIPGQAYSNSLHHKVFSVLTHAENGLASKLFKTIREENALAYAVGMGMMGGFHPGWFHFYAQTTRENAEKAGSMLLAEIERLASTGLEQDEFDKAKQGAIARILKKNDSPAAVMASSVLELFYNAEADCCMQKELDYLQDLSLAEANQLIIPAFADKKHVVVEAGK